jgi:spermidine/putrescine transport system permease protein
MARWLACVLAALSVFATAGCKDEPTGPTAATTQAGAGSAPDATAPAGTLNVYIWSEYLPPEVAERFTARTGIKLTVDTYDSNEALLAKLQSGVADYHVVVPSDYMVTTLVAEKLIRPIDRARLKNLDNLDPQLVDRPYDPGNVHSVPYLWGLTAFAYDKTKVTGTVDSWAALFDARNAKQVSMLDDHREAFAVALKLMGRSLNETDPAVLAQAGDMLKKQKALVKAYDSDDFANKLESGDVWLAHGYTGQLAAVAARHPDRFAVVLPKEGNTVAIDNLCIPTSAGPAEVAAAHQFIDFVLEPQNAADIANGTGYATANLPARKLVDPAILNNPAVYPPADVLKRCEFIRDLGETTEVYDRLWTEVKGEGE